MIIRNGICVLALLLVTYAACGQGSGVNEGELQTIDRKVQSLKKEVVNINKELSQLEERLLFPSTTQIAIFISVKSKRNFRLDSIEFSIDDRKVANYIYTFRELDALRKGGVQRLHTGNISTGNHKLSATIRGKTAGGDPYEKTAIATIRKELVAKFVEMQISASSREPQIQFKDW